MTRMALITSNLRRRLPRPNDYVVGLVLGMCATYANASIFGPKLCAAFNSVAGNDLYSVLAGIGMAGLFTVHALDEGDNKLKTAAIRIGLAATGLVNLQTLSNLVTGSSWGC